MGPAPPKAIKANSPGAAPRRARPFESSFAHHRRGDLQGRVRRPHRPVAALVAEPVRERLHRLARRVPVEPHAPPEEVLGVDEPHEQIAVRDGGAGAAPAVADRPRVGSRALRADLEHPLRVHPEHRAAPRADRPHVHHRDDKGIVAHAGGGGVLRLLALVEREIAARPAEVDGDDPLPAEAPGDARGGDEPGGGAGEHGVDGPFAGRVDAERAPVRGGDVDRRLHPRLGHARLQAVQVGAHERLHVRVHDGDEPALELALLRPDRGRSGDRDPGQAAPERLLHLALHLREGIGVEEEDGDRFHPGRPEVGCEPVEVRRAPGAPRRSRPRAPGRPSRTRGSAARAVPPCGG